MTFSSQTAITPTRSENYPQWYQEVISQGELAEHSVTRGAMVIRPYGFAIWENLQKILDSEIKKKGHDNAYFPLLIPLSLIQKEAEHVEGFAKECAVVTHHRLSSDPDGTLVPDGKLEEPYVIRPTSEMIIGECFSRWIQSYRDLPLKINQWANVMRWEMRTRLFLRTSEFLWQEGHTAHESEEEARLHALDILEMYTQFCQNTLCLPVLKGKKPPHEKFPGAEETYCLESLMQDNKALQAGTSHFMGQNFAKSCSIEYTNKEGKREHAWTTSWGMTTRLIGALIMTHSDDNGLVLPPPIAPYQVVLSPIIRKNSSSTEIYATCENLKAVLEEKGLRVHLDKHEHKKWHWIKKGVPIRVEIGSVEVEKKQVSYFVRDAGAHMTRETLATEDFVQSAHSLLDEISKRLLNSAQKRQHEATQRVETLDELEKVFSAQQAPGFVSCTLHYDQQAENILNKLQATVRYLPLEEKSTGPCILSGRPDAPLVFLAKAY